jgi:hypothetical protein
MVGEYNEGKRVKWFDQEEIKTLIEEQKINAKDIELNIK